MGGQCTQGTCGEVRSWPTGRPGDAQLSCATHLYISIPQDKNMRQYVMVSVAWLQAFLHSKEPVCKQRHAADRKGRLEAQRSFSEPLPPAKITSPLSQLQYHSSIKRWKWSSSTASLNRCGGCSKGVLSPPGLASFPLSLHAPLQPPPHSPGTLLLALAQSLVVPDLLRVPATIPDMVSLRSWNGTWNGTEYSTGGVGRRCRGDSHQNSSAWPEVTLPTYIVRSSTSASPF